MISVYRDLLRPFVFRLDAEKVHELGLKALRVSLRPESAQNAALKRFSVSNAMEVERFGLKFANPVGIAAGFDKNALVVDQLAALGFGFVECGTVTAKPQPGNEKPRLFRLPDDNALINRLGFNNHGAEAAAELLRKSRRKCIVGVNIGKNKDVPNEEAVENYLSCLRIVFESADYIAVNVSSPNTPNLRELQEAESLNELLGALQKENKLLSDAGGPGTLKPVLLKIAPDLAFEALDEIIAICREHRVDGIIAANTTVSREGLKTNSESVSELGMGGLSGAPLKERSNRIIRHIFKKTNGSIPVIGVGGVFDAEDAFEKISAGASLVQGYTGFVYRGPGYAREINQGLLRIFEERGFSSFDAAVGSAV